MAGHPVGRQAAECSCAHAHTCSPPRFGGPPARTLPQGPLVYKGVVFNEMKGVYSSPDAVNGRVTQSALFPANTYVEDSGGDPRAIPDLTFEEFQVRGVCACALVL